MTKAFTLKIKLKQVTIHDLQKIIGWFLSEDYWNPEQEIEIITEDWEDGEN